MKKSVAVAVLVAALGLMVPNSFAADTSNPYGTSKVDPAGPNEVIFTVTKGAKQVGYTAAKLMKLENKVITIYEPFLKKRQSFTVIPINTFFKVVGISGRDKVTTRALNDYIYENTAASFINANAYIAIKRDGLDIPYDQGGPIRLIFDDKSKWAKNLDAWNWSLSSISVK